MARMMHESTALLLYAYIAYFVKNLFKCRHFENSEGIGEREVSKCHAVCCTNYRRGCKVAKRTISFVMYVHLSVPAVRMEQLDSHLMFL